MEPWKTQLFRRLDRIRLACGQLCNLNTPAALEEHYVYPLEEGQQLPTIRVPNVNCPAILGQEEIDEGDLSAPGIPPELLSYFTIGNAYAVSNEPRRKDIYMGGNALQNVWKEADLTWLIQQIAAGTARGTYGVQATRGVRDKVGEIDMKGKSVMVTGSERPWLEAICLHWGAAKVTTLEYGKIVSEHPQIVTLTPDVFRAKYLAGELEEFDGILSHSSLEHSGLGRYGDALNPWGDILAVARAWCVTKSGGFLYVGVPTGKDMIWSNWHRI